MGRVSTFLLENERLPCGEARLAQLSASQMAEALRASWMA